MPGFSAYTQARLKQTLKDIHDRIYTPVSSLDITAWHTKEPVNFAQRQSGRKMALKPGDKWGDLFDCAWFHFTGRVPKEAAGKKVVLLIDVNGELCVVDDKGVPIRGLTSAGSSFDLSLGEPGKRVVQLAARARAGQRVSVWADAGCNDLFGVLRGDGRVIYADIAACDDDMRALFYDFEMLLNLIDALPEQSARRAQVHYAVDAAAKALQNYSPGEVREARKLLAGELNKRGGDPSLTISAVGHAHLDLGWLWPIRETLRKGARTFSTALELIGRYPDYVFGASQPQLFLWMKQHYPELYRKIKRAVKAGRIEAQGAAWVEADANVTSGESWVRQLLHGSRFFRDEFGVTPDYLWLPDVFGYNAALPQILKKSGVNYFMTQKLSWSLINSFPHQSFRWQGIDGTSILTHMLPEENYNSPALPSAIRRIENNYKDKDVSDCSLMLYGIGDGGGGPGAEHLERLSRVRDLAGLARVRQEPAAAFFKDWRKDADRFPKWVGELYLERHQGTFTTQGRNKWYNRRIEQALRELEWAAVLAGALHGAAYPAARLDAIWKEVLLYQFHDILPGSSIKRVYDESIERYNHMLSELADETAALDGRLAGAVDTAAMAKPAIVRNSLSWERSGWLRIGRKWLYATVPAMGYAAVDTADAVEIPALDAEPDRLENDLLRVRLGSDGSIVSIYDKQARREVLAGGGRGNRLALYEDRGDAWDFPMDYAERAPRHPELVSAEARVDGPRAVLRQTWRIGHSEIVQELVLTAGSKRLDFATQILHWRESNTMLRTSFPVAVHAENATFEIQFGSIRRPTHRNTTWDLARDEVPAQKWADLSQRDYGAALLNDSKYGHKVKGNVLDLNLLRSAPYPRPTTTKVAAPGEPDDNFTDQCDHQFVYSLYPHEGDHVAGGVAREAYELNVPLRAVAAEPAAGKLPASASFLQLDTPGVIIEAVKKAEDSNAVIVRMYESDGAAHQATLSFGFPVASVEEVNLMEQEPRTIRLARDRVKLEFAPFEIKTLRLSR